MARGVAQKSSSHITCRSSIRGMLCNRRSWDSRLAWIPCCANVSEPCKAPGTMSPCCTAGRDNKGHRGSVAPQATGTSAGPPDECRPSSLTQQTPTLYGLHNTFFFFPRTFLQPFCAVPMHRRGQDQVQGHTRGPRQSTEVQGGQGKLGRAGRRQASCSTLHQAWAVHCTCHSGRAPRPLPNMFLRCFLHLLSEVQVGGREAMQMEADHCIRLPCSRGEAVALTGSSQRMPANRSGSAGAESWPCFFCTLHFWTIRSPSAWRRVAGQASRVQGSDYVRKTVQVQASLLEAAGRWGNLAAGSSARRSLSSREKKKKKKKKGWPRRLGLRQRTGGQTSETHMLPWRRHGAGVGRTGKCTGQLTQKQARPKFGKRPAHPRRQFLQNLDTLDQEGRAERKSTAARGSRKGVEAHHAMHIEFVLQ